MFGGRYGDESSGRIYLKEGNFERGDKEKFRIEVPKILSPLERILIGHDNSGRSPGWFLDHVDIECPMIGMKQVFRCNKWLAKDEGNNIKSLLEKIKSLNFLYNQKMMVK
jgi:hypothetical protein